MPPTRVVLGTVLDQRCVICILQLLNLYIYYTKTKNIFDSLPAMRPPTSSELRDELDRYLSTDPEHTDDVLLWWTERKHIYPFLSRMALDYLSIPGTLYLASCISYTNIEFHL